MWAKARSGTPIDDGPGRRALYLSCVPERAFAHIPPGKSYNDTILARVGRQESLVAGR